MNFIQIVFCFISFITIFVGSLINCVEPYLPVILTRSFRYGKFAVSSEQPLVAKVEVPKRWYRHFYIFAAPASSYIATLVIYKYCFKRNIPNIIYSVLDLLLGTSRKPLVSAESTLLASILMTFHCWKRVYETQCVNVFSERKMNIFHYLVGFIHYIGVVVSLIGESEGFVKGSSNYFSWQNFTLLHLICASIFLWASFEQLKTNVILGNLRKDENDCIVHTGYKIPNGGLFEYISAPLQFTEILVYVTLSILLWQSTTYHYITVWVLSNQIECALLTHWWYQDTFKGYPKKRKILVPYVF